MRSSCWAGNTGSAAAATTAHPKKAHNCQRDVATKHRSELLHPYLPDIKVALQNSFHVSEIESVTTNENAAVA
jgi:hypothetical protein